MKNKVSTLVLSKEDIAKAANIEIGEIIGVDYMQKEKSNLCKEIVISFVDKDYKHIEFVTKEELVEGVLNKIPEHVFLEVPKVEFLNYVKSVFLKIENMDEIHIPAAVSFLKMRFIAGDVDADLATIMIKNQCKK